MRSVAAIVALVTVVLSAVLVSMPQTRQALNFCASSWKFAFAEPSQSVRGLGRFGKDAEKRRDAQALAFVALRLPAGAESARFADLAVELDARLTWILYVVAAKDLASPRAPEWIARLQAWDPQNAATDLLKASHLITLRGPDRRLPPGTQPATVPSPSADELAAMQAAFAAPKYDSYLKRRIELEREVALRRGHFEPLELLMGLGSHPISPLESVGTYSKILASEGKRAEGSGDFARASAIYWSMAHFGEMMESQVQSDLERILAEDLRFDAYGRLRSIAQGQGDLDEARHLDSLVRLLARRRWPQPQFWAWLDVYQRQSLVLQLSSLVVILSAGSLLALGGYMLSKRWWTSQKSTRWAQVLPTITAVSATCLLFSSASLFFGYQPYAAALKHFAVTADLRALSAFASLVYPPLDVRWALLSGQAAVYFWYGIVVFGAASALVILARKFVRSLRPRMVN